MLSAGSAALIVRPFARDGYLRWMPPPFSVWTRGRDFPAPEVRAAAQVHCKRHTGTSNDERNSSE